MIALSTKFAISAFMLMSQPESDFFSAECLVLDVMLKKTVL